ncbi:hypothetical protein MBCUT_01620 [Methanobrevibacter cuticularis]|uniref:DUF2120 domain-containing protein n=1 Tax=Methanobrevibacter cuticularis TaxID=47311 RepID=A0A166FHN2_9EURY|nr:DUF2120 family protein [Methanobrevibacter cuticularis]KZX17684.1 hypothetical protein MBCUT_01620 [Methanobrevibacter cuticularis]
MVKLHKIAGKVIEHLEAFKGSRAAMDSEMILIVRGTSSQKIAISEMGKKLEEILEILEGTEVDSVSEEASKLINRMDEQIRSNITINGDTDSNGIMRMKKSLEELNLAVEFKLMNLAHAGVFVVIWKDKADVGPIFVEVVVSDDEKE